MLEVRQSWFGDSSPQNWKPARTAIGAGEDGTITIAINSIDETEANGYTIEVEEGVGLSVDMETTLTGKDILVTLGTDAAGDLDATKNTAKLITTEIAKLTGVNATFSGTGADPIAVAIAKKDFTDMQYGTECPEPMVVVRVWDNILTQWDYYVNIAPNGKYDANWRLFNLVEY